MRLIKFLLILILLQSCSFDNKSGIWKNENNLNENEENLFKDFKTLTSLERSFTKLIPIKKNFKFKLSNPKTNLSWSDIFFKQDNNFINFKYNDLNQEIFKGKKITRHKITNPLLYDNKNIVVTDIKGNIFVFSIIKNTIISKFNFYKKKYKNIDLFLNIILEENIIYVSDNIGYLYAFDYVNNKVLWAQNYKIPFRSNLKIQENKLIGVNQNNNLFFINKKDGLIIKSFPTEDNIVKNNFINNLSIENDDIFFLNTYGSLYSIDVRLMQINWFINLNQALNLNLGNLFDGQPIINNNKNIIIISDKYTYIIENVSGTIVKKKNFSSRIKPVLMKNYLFLVTKNNLLISLDIRNGEIIYSYDINQKISEFLNIKKKIVDPQSIMIVNNKIFVFLKNSFFLIFDINGTLEEVRKFKSKINSYPIIVEDKILYLNKKNKLLIVN